jgi:hypothetical protein
MGQSLGLQAARRHKVGILWLKGYSLREIQSLIQKDKELPNVDKTTLVTVWKDVRAVKGQLLKHNIDKLEIQRSRSVEHLRLIQTRAWTELAGTQQTALDKDGNAVMIDIMPTLKTTGLLLGIISATEERIAKLEGTFAPTELTGKGGEPLIPAEPSHFHFPDGSVFTPARLGSDGNGSKDEPIPEA